MELTVIISITFILKNVWDQTKGALSGGTM